MDTKPMIEAREILTDLDTFNPSSPDVVGRVEVAKLARSLINVIEDQQRQIDELRGRLDRSALSPD
jgi:hypothetical protein